MAFAVRWAILLLSLLISLGTILWTVLGTGGLGRKGTQLFNWHPVLMSFSAIVLLPQGALEWNSERENRKTSKWIHGIVLSIAFIGINVAIAIVYTVHSQGGMPNFYSLHSWVGVCAILLLKSNLVGGIISVILPGWRIAKFSGSLHRRVGIFAVAFVLTAAFTGFVELQAQIFTSTSTYFRWVPILGGVLAILTGFVAVFTGAILSGTIQRGDAGQEKVCPHGVDSKAGWKVDSAAGV